MSAHVRRSAHASWQGTVAEGGGRIGLDSGAYEGPFTLKARIDGVENATNPEELIAAAEAGCFTMSLASLLEEQGTPAAEIQTNARVRLEQKPEGFRITRMTVQTVGRVPGVDAARFIELAEQAKATCPVSLALAGTEIVLDASLQ
jgi:osmotically inducible protein OsmC